MNERMETNNPEATEKPIHCHPLDIMRQPKPWEKSWDERQGQGRFTA